MLSARVEKLGERGGQMSKGREMLSQAGRSAANGAAGRENKGGGKKPTLLHNESQSLAGRCSTSAKLTSAVSLRKPTFTVPPLFHARHCYFSSWIGFREDRNASLRLQMRCNTTQVGSPSPRRVLQSSAVEISSKQGPCPLLKC